MKELPPLLNYLFRASLFQFTLLPSQTSTHILSRLYKLTSLQASPFFICYLLQEEQVRITCSFFASIFSWTSPNYSLSSSSLPQLCLQQVPIVPCYYCCYAVFFLFSNFEISNEITSDFKFFFFFRGGGAGKIEGARASSHHHYHHHRHLHQRQKRYGFEKLFVFGDSYADTGNIQKSVGNSWKQPYGITFPGKPAGRFSDGRVLTDYVGTYKALFTLPFFIIHTTIQCVCLRYSTLLPSLPLVHFIISLPFDLSF